MTGTAHQWVAAIRVPITAEQAPAAIADKKLTIETSTTVPVDRIFCTACLGRYGHRHTGASCPGQIGRRR